MRRITNILCLALIVFLMLVSCESQKMIEPIENLTTENIPETDKFVLAEDEHSLDTEINYENVDSELEKNIEPIQVYIDVYINEQLIDVRMFRNTSGSRAIKPDNFSDFALAYPILNFLNITYTVDEKNDSITLYSDKYGTISRTYNEYAKVIEDELYIKFSLFNFYTNGSLKQNDSSAMYLYTGDYERTDLPKTLEECYTMFNDLLSDENKEILKKSTEQERFEMHFGLGMWIRNEWLYPTQSKLTNLIDENGVHHIDDMSSIIIEGYYRYLNDEPCSLDDMLSWYFEQ